MNTELKPGMWFHASCSDEWVGPILRVGKDANGTDVIDLTVPDINEFISTEEGFHGATTSLMSVSPKEAVFYNLQYEYDGKRHIELNTPGDNCYRCSKYFSVHRQREFDPEYREELGL